MLKDHCNLCTLRPQLLLLQLGNNLAAEQRLAGPALLPLQTDHVYMLPLRPAPPERVILQAQIILALQRLYNGRALNGLMQGLIILLVNGQGTQVVRQVLIAAAGGELAAL